MSIFTDKKHTQRVCRELRNKFGTEMTPDQVNQARKDIIQKIRNTLKDKKEWKDIAELDDDALYLLICAAMA